MGKEEESVGSRDRRLRRRGRKKVVEGEVERKRLTDTNRKNAQRKDSMQVKNDSM